MTAAGETVFALHNLDNCTKRYLHLEFNSKRFQRFFERGSEFLFGFGKPITTIYYLY